MARLYLVRDSVEIARRRARLASGHLVEAWPDLRDADHVWLGEESKTALEGEAPLPATLSIDGAAVPIYYGPRLLDVASLPREESLQARVLSAGGIAVAWVTLDAAGQRRRHEPASPLDPVFYLRRPRGAHAHLWRLFRTRDEASRFVDEQYPGDAEAAAWARAVPAASFEDLVQRFGTAG